jgi:hypothetical protein
MGTDIYGWVEVRDPVTGAWGGVVKLDHLVPRDYDAFGCLFGVMNYANFRPVAPARGLPPDVSDELTQDYAEQEGAVTLGETWIGAAELAGLDGGERALDADLRPTRYRRAADGTLERVGKEISGHTAAHIAAGHLTWEEEGHLFQRETLTRDDVLVGPWQTLVALTRVLGAAYGREHVRLVVWFDR